MALFLFRLFQSCPRELAATGPFPPHSDAPTPWPGLGDYMATSGWNELISFPPTTIIYPGVRTRICLVPGE